MLKKWFIIMAVISLAACTQTQKDFALVDTKGYLSNPESVSDLSQEAIDANHQFALALYQQLQNQQKNVFFSPLSIQLALSMTANGAANSTLKEMLDVLRYTNIEQMNELSRLTQSYLLSQSDRFTINNSVWIKDDYRSKVKQPFLDDVVRHYGSMIAVLDFSQNSAAATINQWVKENTNGKISEVVEPPIDPLTVMFLINTLTFGAKWATSFDKMLTKNDFFANVKDKIQYIVGSRMMPFFEDQRVQIGALVTEDQQQEILILLPKDNAALTPAEISEYLLKELPMSSVAVMLPKVILNAEVELKDALAMMGMPTAFLENMADFSNMAQDAKADGLHIFSVLHKTFWMLDEEGTEAAAVTKVEMQIKSVPTGDYSFVVNRPYTVIIRDRQTGLILFMGHIIHPQP